MKEILPEAWSGTDLVSPGDIPLASSDRCGGGLSFSWLCAFPHPAALLRWTDGAPTFDLWNEPFARKFGSLLVTNADTGGDSAEAQWITRLYAMAVDFVLSDKVSSHFLMERMTPLGTEEFACSLAWIRADEPAEERILLTAVDRTADRRIEESLRRELISDSLTALPNRIGFGEALETMLEAGGQGGGTHVGVAIIDLMRFGLLNEALGAMAGDELILAVAARLKACVGPEVTLARLGGNEFGICHVAANGITTVIDLADEIAAALSAPIRLSNLEISISSAVGCSLAPIGDAEADELIRQAQTAARSAKQSGRLEIYRAGELGAARQRFILESRLRRALADGELSLSYQPIIDLSSSQVIAFEALARWEDAEIGRVSPGEFIPVAEESGLIVQLGRWALNQAMHQLNLWDTLSGARVPVKMNVNLSSIQMVRDDVITTIGDALRLNGVDGDRLMIELTESAIIADPANCRRLLESVKRSDISIAMDDFGTGFSNMESLQSLPIDLLKIDRNFVTDMLADPDKMAIIRAVLSLAKALGMKTTAEGIEDADVAEHLRDMGCDFGQGFYFARAMTADDAYKFWLSRRNSDT